ncbi:MAG TPA: galactokinase [Firmicutes bacterium]|nr:galactokinase [Bacillota bacterium]
MINEKDYAYRVSAAGRVNLIGEHVDYCGGKVMPAALSLKNTVYIRPNGTDRINLAWTDIPARITLDIGRLGEYKDVKYANYPAGCAYLWQQAGHKVIGCDMLHDCTVPFGSGLSSSAAIEVSTIAALATIAGEPLDPVEIALVAQKAEREYAGVNCGIMDQYASACGKKDNAILLDCKTLVREYVPILLGDYTLVIANCNKPHSLVESKYNERRSETERALELLRTKADISCLAELTPDAFERIAHVLDGEGKVRDRARHVVEECDRVRRAAGAMKRGDVGTLGELLNASHASLRDLYKVTGVELDTLAEAAQAHPACAGSRMTGAGFGGCTVSVVQKDGVADFKKTVSARYTGKIGYEPSFYDCTVEDGIIVTKL